MAEGKPRWADRSRRLIAVSPRSPRPIKLEADQAECRGFGGQRWRQERRLREGGHVLGRRCSEVRPAAAMIAV